jgi:hypothetical protein
MANQLASLHYQIQKSPLSRKRRKTQSEFAGFGGPGVREYRNLSPKSFFFYAKRTLDWSIHYSKGLL